MIEKLRAALEALEAAEQVLNQSYRDSVMEIGYRCHTSAVTLRSVIAELEAQSKAEQESALQRLSDLGQQIDAGKAWAEYQNRAGILSIFEGDAK